MFFNVYAWMPRNMFSVILVWPPTLVVSICGVVYGFLGIRRDAQPRWATWGLILNLVFGFLVSIGTAEAVDALYRAFRYNNGIVFQSTR